MKEYKFNGILYVVGMKEYFLWLGHKLTYITHTTEDKHVTLHNNILH